MRTWRSLAIIITPFRWRLMPCHEKAVCESLVRWLCVAISWDNPIVLEPVDSDTRPFDPAGFVQSLPEASWVEPREAGGVVTAFDEERNEITVEWGDDSQ